MLTKYNYMKNRSSIVALTGILSASALIGGCDSRTYSGNADGYEVRVTQKWQDGEAVRTIQIYDGEENYVFAKDLSPLSKLEKPSIDEIKISAPEGHPFHDFSPFYINSLAYEVAQNN